MVVVLGYGRVGRAVAFGLRRYQVAEITIVTSQLQCGVEPGLRFVSPLTGWTSSFLNEVRFDTKPEIIINALPPHFGISALTLAIRYRAHYIDLSACEPHEGVFEPFPYAFQKSFDAAFRQIGKVGCLSFGCDPGVSNLIVQSLLLGSSGTRHRVDIFDLDYESLIGGDPNMNVATKEADRSYGGIAYLNGKFKKIPVPIGLDLVLACGARHRVRLVYHDELASLPFTCTSQMSCLRFWGSDELSSNLQSTGSLFLPFCRGDAGLHVGALIGTQNGGVFRPERVGWVSVNDNLVESYGGGGRVAVSAAIPAVAMCRILNGAKRPAPGIWLPEELRVDQVMETLAGYGLPVSFASLCDSSLNAMQQAMSKVS